MKISGSFTLDATRDEVWEALNDIDVLARVVPGCERLDQTGDNEFEGTVKIGIQSIKGTYNGRIRLEDIQPPHHYKLVAHGKSANGVVDGSGTVDLEEQGEKTLLKYGGDAQIGGVLASVGQRLVEGAARQLINQSLKALAEQIEKRRSGAEAEAPAAPKAEAPAAPKAEAPAAPKAAAPAKAETTPANVSVTQLSTQPALPTQTGPAAPAEPRRSVVVPESEQLKPEAVLSGALLDFYKERPWIPWVIVAFLLGYLLGRSKN
ncbi:MAG TPA: carbon monoxide dehydrogenase subunit G [Roseiflexaceae bacterium]|nr:carbon monoxide dehydrogenase subunit G [Roseiflexaceae bacterium]